MKLREKILSLFLVLFLASTIILGRRIWNLQKEERAFEGLLKRVETYEAVYQQKEKERTHEFRLDGPYLGEAEKKVILPKYKELHEENRNLAGWVKVEHTKISYPVKIGRAHV